MTVVQKSLLSNWSVKTLGPASPPGTTPLEQGCRGDQEVPGGVRERLAQERHDDPCLGSEKPILHGGALVVLHPGMVGSGGETCRTQSLGHQFGRSL